MSLFFSPSLCSVLRARKTNRNDSFIYKCLLTKKEKEMKREKCVVMADSAGCMVGNLAG